MSSPLLPSTRLVAAAWLQLAIPGVGAGRALPEASDDLRASGFLRVVPGAGGGPDRDVPAYRSPVVQVECWWPAATRSQFSHWTRAEQLAERVIAATGDPALMGLVVDLSTVGNYGSARVHDVIAESDPEPVEEDPSNWGRVDVDLTVNWTGV